MKNSTFFPFEKNKYFYGKLLSVDDFNLEQKYISDKRRMSNLFLYGAGIVAGMQVVHVDDTTISVEMGFALDSLGREIVIEAPVIRNLSSVDGFKTIEGAESGYTYLCVEYDEVEQDKVYNIAGNIGLAQGTDAVAYNKVRESYHLYLTNLEPQRECLSQEELYLEYTTVYFQSGIHIKQVVPKYIQAGEKFEIKLLVETTQIDYLSFSYQLALTCLNFQKTQLIDVVFDEMLHEKTGSYMITYEAEAVSASGIDGVAAVVPESFKVFLGRKPIDAWSEAKSTVHIIKNNPKDEVLNQYYREAMENQLKNSSNEPLYLAKIYLMKAGDSYMIDHILNVPFQQYVMNHVLGSALNQMLQKDFDKLSDCKQTASGESSQKEKREDREKVLVTEGSCKLKLGIEGQKGKRFFSKEIIHGLGLGRVTIVLGLETGEKEIIYGERDVFEADEPDVLLAAKLNQDKGSFIIGAKLVSTTTLTEIKVHWTAVLHQKEETVQVFEKKIFIKPSVLELGMRESYYLEAAFQNIEDKAVKWKVINNGGTIESNGMYTAPNVPGVYEIIAESIAYPEVKASIFAVVREGFHSDRNGGD
ncbi:hypothetical protein [Anaeromicropila populeti]|uniref:Uncharacterized protein n=1 Tax=Anaeromicropila populeti TaxID=37658 RepID=A0A1I6LUA8_9FIRM|nr:hypothetical protein [Anaeromicropila populeti]SFS06862.1 hypothetical protein SAMN05661086_03558 [Anaeromicropila populeti]